MTDTINQTPAEKANDLFDKYLSKVGGWISKKAQIENAKECALIVVDEIIPCTWKEETYYKKWGIAWVAPETTTEYWEAVREAIKAL